MEYAVIRTGGKQYRVSQGDILEVDKLPFEKDKSLTFEDVLLWVSNGQTKIGTPVVSDVKVKAKVIDQVKGDKIRVAKFKSKVRYRRVMGFRAQLTLIQIEKIELRKVQQSKRSVSSEANSTAETSKAPAKHSRSKQN